MAPDGYRQVTITDELLAGSILEKRSNAMGMGKGNDSEYSRWRWQQKDIRRWPVSYTTAISLLNDYDSLHYQTTTATTFMLQ